MKTRNGLAWCMVSEHWQTSKDEVDDSNVECHASQHYTVVCRQWRLIKQRLENEERQSWQLCSEWRHQNVSWKKNTTTLINDTDTDTEFNKHAAKSWMHEYTCTVNRKKATAYAVQQINNKINQTRTTPYNYQMQSKCQMSSIRKYSKLQDR